MQTQLGSHAAIWVNERRKDNFLGRIGFSGFDLQHKYTY